MLTTTIKADRENHLFEEQWFPKLFSMCKENRLEWLRMAALIYLLSGGEVGYRIIDWNFICEYLGPDNPNYLRFYDDNEDPTAEIIDRGTKWGLYQIHGETARNLGYKGQYLGLASIGANIKYGIEIMQKSIDKIEERIKKLEDKGEYFEAAELQKQMPFIAEQDAFGIDKTQMEFMVAELKEECQRLLEMSDV